MWSVSVHEWMKTLWKIKPGHLYIWDILAATRRIFMAVGCPFLTLLRPFTFFVIFGPLRACLEIKKAFAAYLILLGTWCALESGSGYLSSGCLVRGLRTTVLRTLSFTFDRGGRRLSPLFSTMFWYLILIKSNIILQAMEAFLIADFFRGFFLNLICWVPQVIRDTSSYVGYPELLSNYAGYLELYWSYSAHRHVPFYYIFFFLPKRH